MRKMYLVNSSRFDGYDPIRLGAASSLGGAKARCEKLWVRELVESEAFAPSGASLLNVQRTNVAWQQAIVRDEVVHRGVFAALYEDGERTLGILTIQEIDVYDSVEEEGDED